MLRYERTRQARQRALLPLLPLCSLMLLRCRCYAYTLRYDDIDYATLAAEGRRRR